MQKNIVWTALALVFALAMPANRTGAHAAEPMEFIRVSPDGWNFETAHSHQRFIPFGGSMVFAYNNTSGSYMDFLNQDTWDPVTLRKVFEGAHSANINLMKVFIFTLRVLPDPQTNDQLAFKPMDPPFLERLDQLFQIARETGVYVSLCSAEWGIGWNQWFLGGGNFFGRNPQDGVDSFTVYRNLWTTLAERYKNEPALFSYNLAVEFYMPGGNWRAEKPDPEGKDAYFYMFNETWGTSRWRTWLSEQYTDIAALNKAWGLTNNNGYASFSKIPQPYIVWDGKPAYTRPQGMIADYNSFKEVVSYRFLKNQADAIRAVDKGHMITAGQHPQHPAIVWGGAAMYDNGIAPTELDFLDYTTVHVYTSPTDPNGLHSAVIAARFAHHPGKPLIAEEIGHLVPDQQQSLDGTKTLLNTLVGHVSGFQLWVLGQTGAEGKSDTNWGPLGLDYALNDWGREWKKLAEPGGVVANLPLTRAAAQVVLTSTRLNEMCPIDQPDSIKLIWNWNSYKQPFDFNMPPNPAIAKIRPVPVVPDRTSIMPLWWKNY
jgi:hypothetical protein